MAIFQAQQGLLGQAFGGGLQQAYTQTFTSAASTSIYALPYGVQSPIPEPVIPSNDPVTWLKQRVKEIEWRA